MTRGQPLPDKRPSTPRRDLHAQQKLERRRALLSAAGQVFGDKGYGAANVDDIVKLAGVARGTFYLYFADKEAVFTALVDDFMTRLEGVVVSIDVTAAAQQSPLEQLRQNLTRVVELALNEPTWMRLALHEATSQGPELAARIDAFYANLHAILDRSFSTGQRLGLVRQGDRRVMAAIGLGGLKEMIYRAARDGWSSTPSELVEEMLRFLSEGLLAIRPEAIRPDAIGR